MDTEYRKKLIEKYLDAGTSVEEEHMLAEWFSAHEAGPGEEPVRKLILAEYPETYYTAAGKEFDSIVAKASRRSRITKWAFGLAACTAVITGLGIFFTQRKACDFNGIEIAQGIEHIMSLDIESIESITARPKGNNVIITALMKDGSTCSYLMSKDAGTSALSITAMNK